ncbi:MAG: thiol-disulfide oxidoreductase DCC family protein [Candidatus Sericytochromatia bacterium]
MKKALILFDGVCNLCNSSVNFIIDHDPEGYFQFAALQSEAGQAALAEHGLSQKDFDSVVLIENGKASTKSTAALQIGRRFGGAWGLLGGLLIVPAFLRNLVYDVVAANRYRWFGKQEQCRLPTPALRSRFLD